MQYPKRRTDLQSEALGEGLAIIDAARNERVALNATAALVWQRCDGETSAPELGALLQRKFNLGPAQAERLVALTLEELAQAELIDRNVTTPRLRSRRQVMEAAVAAGLAVMLAPMVARATCRGFVTTTTAAPTTTTTAGPPVTATRTRPPRVTTAPPPTTTT
jgi:hypothetical protein